MKVHGAELRFERVLAAPRAVVFRALTEADLIRRWMCPEGFVVPEAETNPRAGGQFRVVMRRPDGTRHPASGEYIEVRPPEVVAFTWTWEAPHTMAGVVTRIRVELTDRGGATLLVMTHSGLPEAERESHRGGWTGALNNLERLLEEERKQWTT